MVLANSTIRMGVFTFILCQALFFSAIGQDQQAISKKEMKEVSRIFEEEAGLNEVILSEYSLPSDLELRDGDRLYQIAGENENLGYMLSTSAKGRFDFFDYTIFYSEQLVVEGLIVTTYRSTHGAAICQKKWLSQFHGYQGGELTLGKDVDAISGASFSAESIVKDVQRCHAMMTGLKGGGIIQ